MMTFRLMTLFASAAAALALSACADGINGHDGAAGTSCKASAIADTSGKALGYALVCSDSSGVTSRDTVWNGTDGSDGASCSAKAVVGATKDTSYVLVCAGDTVGVIADGTDGADCSASALASGKGYAVTCGDSTFALLSGTNGAAGTGCSASDTTASGVPGYKITCGDSVMGVVWNGTAGTNGAAGKSCSVSDTAKAGVTGYKIVCGGIIAGVVWNGTAGDSGADGTSCSVTSAGDSVVQVCGADTVVTYKAWCGTVSYDPAAMYCMNDTLYSRKCGNRTYDPATRFCVDSSLYYLCGGKKYDPAKEYCRNAVEPAAYGSLDYCGQLYKTVVIGAQTWMAENLNCADTVLLSSIKNSSWCYDNDTANCTKYGRLYTWSAAAASSSQGICPSGWHLPDTTDWDALVSYVGDSLTAGGVLKASNGWGNTDTTDTYNGTDAYGFSALSGGYYNDDGYFNNLGLASGHASFWSATSFSATLSWQLHLGFNGSYAQKTYGQATDGISVRCIKD